MRKITKLNLLAVCICIANQSYALEALNDQNLEQVTGQDGITITHEVSRVNIDQANWIDYSGVGTNPIKLGLHDVNIQAAQGNASIKSQVDLDVGATTTETGAKGAGIQLSASVSPFTATAAKIMLMCEPHCAAGEVNQNLGSLSLSTISPLKVYLATTNGLFNRDDIAHFSFSLQNASIGYGQNGQAVTAKDFNFNFAADGYMYVDSSEGMVLTTKSRDGKTDHVVTLGRVEDKTDVHGSRNGIATNPGVNIDFRYGSEGSNQGNLIRMGASGELTNAKIFLNSNQTGVAQFTQVNRGSGNAAETMATAVTGYDFKNAGGLHFGLSADFLHAGSNPTIFELGHTGTGSYAIEFSNLTRLNVRTSNDPAAPVNLQNAYLDLGDIYLNNIRSNSLSFVVNEQIKNVLGAATAEQIYNPSPTANAQNMVLAAIRGMDFQALARKARFISDNSIADINAGAKQASTWGLGIPIYNLNANVALYSKDYINKSGTAKMGLGYDLAMSTDGYGIDTKTGTPNTTSIIIIDGAEGSHGEEVNYYAGLRNIDSYIKSKGVIGFEENEIYVKADSLLMAAQAEVAIGQLPGSLYNCTAGQTQCAKKVVPIDNFSKKDDVLTTIAFKLDGKGEIFIIPGLESENGTPDTNFLSLKANFQFNPLTGNERGSYISLINDDVSKTGESTQSSINLNKIQGDIALESRIHMQKDTVVLDNQIKFNRLGTTASLGKPFTAELAIAPVGTMQKIADIAIPGGVMRSSLGITPR
ncbi:DUF6160 family protein [Acinetobacter sp.]|jgi:hypothetical protein|uniref:DUF6160 family protein n=1 Tax=Acinetobacter sp. TaxID=472 RepID=UPI0035B04A2E